MCVCSKQQPSELFHLLLWALCEASPACISQQEVRCACMCLNVNANVFFHPCLLASAESSPLCPCVCLTREDYQKFTLLCRFVLSPSDRWRGRARDERGSGAMEERRRSLPRAAPKHQESLKVMTWLLFIISFTFFLSFCSHSRQTLWPYDGPSGYSTHTHAPTHTHTHKHTSSFI